MNQFVPNEPIAFTRVALPWGWLGNMSAHRVVLTIQHAQSSWPTTEHLFQAMRLPANHPAVKDMLRNANPMAAKLAAKKHAAEFIIEPLSPVDLDNMRTCLRVKLAKHPALKAELLASGERTIIEDVSSRRNKGSALFWGAANDGDHWTGDNWLGVLWMELRAKLREENN